jgi:LuxR family transcriptional regulator, maltose regulon positive regulatory protein
VPLAASASEAHLGLARICYEWNDLDGAEQHGQQSIHLAGQYERGIDRFIICEVFLARLKLAQGDPSAALATLEPWRRCSIRHLLNPIRRLLHRLSSAYCTKVPY